MSEAPTHINAQNPDVIAWRLTQIERAQERTAEAVEKFRSDLTLLATKADLAKLEERVDSIEDRVDRVQEKVGDTWVKVAAIGGGVLAVLGTLVQFWMKGA